MTVIGRRRGVEAIRQEGLDLRDAEGASTAIRSIRAAVSIAEAFHGAHRESDEAESGRAILPLGRGEGPVFDAVLLTVKSYDTAAALDEMEGVGAGLTVRMPVVLSLQNGVGNEEAVAARFAPHRVIAGTVTAPVEVIRPGVVQVTKSRYAIGLSPWERRPGASVPAGLGPRGAADAFNAAGIPTRIYGDAKAMKWTKLLMNMIGNATSAILAEPPSAFLNDTRIANLEISALREALGVMAAAGIRPTNLERYPLGTLAPFLRFGPRLLLREALRRAVAGGRGGKMPSLYMDLEAGKQGSEVDWYNGAIVRKGAEVGAETPVNRLLLQTVTRLAEEPELRAAWRGKRALLAERFAAACRGRGEER